MKENGKKVVDTDKREEAEKDYMLGMKQKDIAEKYGVSIDTVKSWRKRYEWGAKKGADEKGVQTGGAKPAGTPKNKGVEEQGGAKKGADGKGVQTGGAKSAGTLKNKGTEKQRSARKKGGAEKNAVKKRVQKGVQKKGAKVAQTQENQALEDKNEALKKGVHPTTTKKGVQKRGAKGVQNDAPETEFEPVPENGELTDKQRLFCSYYVRCFNATKAYQKAYGVTYETASKISYRMMGNDGIKNEIQRLRLAKLKKENLKVEDVFQKYLDIAFSDITDYVEFGRETVPVMGAFGPVVVEDKETGEKKELKKEINVVRFKESAVVDGTLITEVRQGKDGASIKLADKMKALEWITEHMGTVDGDIVIKIKGDKKFDG